MAWWATVRRCAKTNICLLLRLFVFVCFVCSVNTNTTIAAASPFHYYYCCRVSMMTTTKENITSLFLHQLTVVSFNKHRTKTKKNKTKQNKKNLVRRRRRRHGRRRRHHRRCRQPPSPLSLLFVVIVFSFWKNKMKFWSLSTLRKEAREGETKTEKFN